MTRSAVIQGYRQREVCYVVVKYAVGLEVEKAKADGVASVAMLDSSHPNMMIHCTRMATEGLEVRCQDRGDKRRAEAPGVASFAKHVGNPLPASWATAPVLGDHRPACGTGRLGNELFAVQVLSRFRCGSARAFATVSEKIVSQRRLSWVSLKSRSMASASPDCDSSTSVPPIHPRRSRTHGRLNHQSWRAKAFGR